VRAVVIAFVLGTAAVWVVLLVAGFALGIAAQSGGWGSFRVGFGLATLLEFSREPAGTSTTFGPGLALAALLGGALNAAAAAWLRRRLG
jgi:hypothetical protein